MYIEQRGKNYRVVVTHNHQKETATFPTKGECKAWGLQKELELRSLKRGLTVPGKTLSDVLDRYGKEVSPTKKGHLWELKRIKVLKRYRIASLLLSSLSAQDVASWRDQRLTDVSGSSVNRDWNLLSHAVEIARKEWGWTNANPFKKEVTRPKSSPPRQEVFTDSEVEKICLVLGDSGVSGAVKQAFLFALETAMRAGEIVGLRKDDLRGSYVHLRETKNGSTRDVPLSKKAQEILERYPNGFGLSSRQLDSNFRKAKKLAGVDKKFHDSRHTAITRLAKVYSVLELARVTGHKNINELMTYYNPSIDDLAQKLSSPIISSSDTIPAKLIL